MRPPDKLAPKSSQAEEAVLGSILLDPGAFYAVSEVLLNGRAFHAEHRGFIYDAMRALHKRQEPADVVTLCEELEKRGQLADVGGPAYITFLLNAVPTAIHADYYAQIVAQKWAYRRLIDAAGQIAQLAYAEELGPAGAFSAATDILLGIAPRTSGGLKKLSQIIDGAVPRYEEMLTGQRDIWGISTGFPDLDRALGGLQAKDLILLAGRPSMGKTALALNIAKYVAQAGAPVAFFSAEMGEESILDRLVCADAEVDSYQLRTGKVGEFGVNRIWSEIYELNKLPLWVDERPGTTQQIRSKVAQYCAKRQLGLVVFDYLGLAENPGDKEYSRVTKISRELKQIAKVYRVPLLALCQLSRKCESRKPPIPRLPDLRDSGALEQDADVVLFIYRQDYYDAQNGKTPGEKENIADIIIAKQRSGPTGRIELFFDKTHTRFQSIAREELNL